MSCFVVTLTNQLHDCDVYFDIHDTSIAKKWKLEIEKDHQLFEIDRFTNWPNSDKTREYYLAELNKQIDIINYYHPGTITASFDTTSTQDTMNYLHKFFEELRGPVETPNEWYLNAHLDAQQALTRYNVLIHEYEHFCFNERTLFLTNHPYATIVGTFNCPRIRLNDDDYDHYTFKWRFGEVYINYCEIGKPLLDVFKDQDEIVGSANIKPLHYYSADFQIKFGPSTVEEIYKKREREFWKWYQDREEFFKSIGLLRSNKLALGMIPVASINTEKSNFKHMSQIDIVHELSKFNQIKSVCIK